MQMVFDDLVHFDDGALQADVVRVHTVALRGQAHDALEGAGHGSGEMRLDDGHVDEAVGLQSFGKEDIALEGAACAL